MKVSKVMTAKEAVSKFIQDGTTMAIGSFFHTIAYDITHEIIRQEKKHLTICAPSFNDHADQMIGAGCVDRIESSYVWMEVFGPLYCFRRAMEKGIPHKIEMEDYTNFAMTVRLLAGSLGIPYVPVHSMKGSDKIPSVVALRMHLFLPSIRILVISTPNGVTRKVTFKCGGSWETLLSV